MGREITKKAAIEQEARRLVSSPEIDTNMRGSVNQLPFLSLNHVSFVCKSLKKSVQFYQQVLGFILIKRPSSFDFEGAWLFNHGIGIHLLESSSELNVKKEKGKINPKDNHISFQCSDMDLIIHKLEGMEIEYVKAVVKEGGIVVDQIFFHDPDGYMIEICNCQNLPVLPLSACKLQLKNMPLIDPNITNLTAPYPSNGKVQCSSTAEAEAEALMIQNLAMDMMNISI